MQNLREFDQRQHGCRQLVWEEGMLIWTRVAADGSVESFSLEEHEVEQRRTAPQRSVLQALAS